MTGLKTFVRVALLTSLGAFGSLQASELTEGAAVTSNGTSMRAPAQYGCCWIMHMGRWWCMPC